MGKYAKYDKKKLRSHHDNLKNQHEGPIEPDRTCDIYRMQKVGQWHCRLISGNLSKSTIAVNIIIYLGWICFTKRRWENPICWPEFQKIYLDIIILFMKSSSVLEKTYLLLVSSLLLISMFFPHHFSFVLEIVPRTVKIEKKTSAIQFRTRNDNWLSLAMKQLNGSYWFKKQDFFV